uniref:Haloacid dehalogenase-like hydrolase domain-containing 5 n=1 Tax=Biomphalaria glabrata TaxID=6526 RepID=A0A2C9KRJ4_BIOGL
MACRRALRAHSPCRQPFAVQLLRLIKGCGCAVRNFHTNKTAYNKCQFGFLFDIDGVIVRGRKPLPHAKEAFQLLAQDGQFKVPTPPCAFEEFFPKIEAVILFGEPVRWETPMQLIMDVLLTDGQPSNDLPDIPYPHLPVLACNMDLLWMAENRLPRSVFQPIRNLDPMLPPFSKITGKEMKYTALIGKPSEITYHHADYLLTQQAKLLGVPHIRRIYCVGDNPTTDIYGGNLYNRYLQRRRKDSNTPSQTASKKRRVASHRADDEFLDEDNDDEDDMDTSIYQRDSGANMRVIKSLEEDKSGVEKALSCETILVCTGVFKKGTETTALLSPRLICNHNHRDFVIDPMLINPTHVVPDVLEAVKLVFEKETYP